jgi:hypothetical protein
MRYTDLLFMENTKAVKGGIMRKVIFVLFVFCLLSPHAALAAAAKCTNLMGTWNVTGTAVYYDTSVNEDNPTPTYATMNDGNPTTVNITSQNGCLLAGYVEYLPPDPDNGPRTYNFTGVISVKTLTLNMGGGVELDAVIASSKKMTFTCTGCDPGFYYDGYGVTLTGAATKK